MEKPPLTHTHTHTHTHTQSQTCCLMFHCQVFHLKYLPEKVNMGITWGAERDEGDGFDLIREINKSTDPKKERENEWLTYHITVSMQEEWGSGDIGLNWGWNEKQQTLGRAVSIVLCQNKVQLCLCSSAWLNICLVMWGLTERWLASTVERCQWPGELCCPWCRAEQNKMQLGHSFSGSIVWPLLMTLKPDVRSLKPKAWKCLCLLQQLWWGEIIF